jgi:hypothetical protein
LPQASAGTVPRHDRTDDTDRFAHFLHDQPGHGRGDSAMQLGRPARIIVGERDRELDQEVRVSAHDPAVEHVQIHQRIAIVGEQDRQAAQSFFAFRRRQIAPAAVLESNARGADCAIDIGGGAARDVREDAAGPGLVIGEALARQGRHGLAFDEMSELSVFEKTPRSGGQRVGVESRCESGGAGHEASPIRSVMPDTRASPAG